MCSRPSSAGACPRQKPTTSRKKRRVASSFFEYPSVCMPMIAMGASRSAVSLLLQALPPDGCVPRARRQIVEPDQIHIPAAAVPGDREQIFNAVEPRFARQIIRDVLETNPLNRIDDDLPIVHRVATARFDVRARPDADAAPDPPAADSLA